MRREEMGPAAIAELRQFVEYYAKHGADRLGNGEAFQHYDRSRKLLEQIDAAKAPPVRAIMRRR